MNKRHYTDLSFLVEVLHSFVTVIFYYALFVFSDESDFNQSGSVSPQKTPPGGSLHSGTVVRSHLYRITVHSRNIRD